MLRSMIEGFRHIAMMLARVAVGVLLVLRGWYRWNTAGVDTQISILTDAGMPAPELFGWLVLLFELGGGVLLIFGLFTPLVGLGMVVLNVGIIVLRKMDAIFIHDGGLEYNLTMAAIGILFMAFGSGKLGADALFFPPKEPAAPDPAPTPTPPRESERTLFSQDSHSESMENPNR